MFRSFFAQAALSPPRQRSFRGAVIAHLALLAGCVWWACYQPRNAGGVVGLILLTAGIVEGAVLVGWRLTQLPKSQALEFLLVSPLRPPRILLAEASVGLMRLALVTLSGLPVLVLFVLGGYIDSVDLTLFLAMPWTWGAITGLALTVWAYEPVVVRRWAERFMMVMIVIYLVVGVLAGEHLVKWIRWLPGIAGQLALDSVEALHRYNPFGAMYFWMTEDLPATWERTLGVEIGALVILGLLLARGAARLHGHFHDRHYRPAEEGRGGPRGIPGDRPLSWWAVRRVTEYSGRANLWLAGGFGLLYAIYTLAGPKWPAWLGRTVFQIFDNAGGVPLWATALVVLSAVPAAFQYGLWDSNAHDRCRRLELLLLTDFTAYDYWHAAAKAAWRRGRGYFGVAVVLWTAGALSLLIDPAHAVAALGVGVILWCLYFVVGFRAFSRGMEANRLGLVLTIVFPAAAFGLQLLGWPDLAALVPPGSVYYAARPDQPLAWAGAALAAGTALWVARRTLASCDRELRLWYDKHHGRAMLD